MPLNKKNIDPLEQLLKDTFDEYTIPATQNSWVKIKKDLIKKQFLKFNISQFNIYYLTALLTATISLSFVNFNSDNEIKNDIVEQEQMLPIVNEVYDNAQTELINKADVINNNDTIKRKINAAEKEFKQSNSPCIAKENNITTADVMLDDIVETNDSTIKLKEEILLSDTVQAESLKLLSEEKEELLINDLKDISTIVSNQKENENCNILKADSIIEDEVQSNTVIKVDTIEKVVRIKRNRRNKGKKRIK